MESAPLSLPMQVSPSALNVAIIHHSVIAWSSTHNIYGSSPDLTPFILIMGTYDIWLLVEVLRTGDTGNLSECFSIYKLGSLAASSLLDASSTV